MRKAYDMEIMLRSSEGRYLKVTYRRVCTNFGVWTTIFFIISGSMILSSIFSNVSKDIRKKLKYLSLSRTFISRTKLSIAPCINLLSFEKIDLT